MWENRDIRYNVLRAVGYFKGKPAAEDVLVLNGLEKAPHFEALYRGSAIVPVAADRLNGTDLLKGAEGYTYLYRLNCGGDAYTDTYGQVWAQDNSRYSHSWAESFIHPSDSVQLLSLIRRASVPRMIPFMALGTGNCSRLSASDAIS